MIGQTLDDLLLLERVTARSYGLNPADVHCLGLLHRSGPAQPGQLAVMLGYSSGGITTVLYRLESKGYVVREPYGGDMRKAWVVPTPKGEQVQHAVWRTLAKQMERELADYSDDNLIMIAQAIARFRTVIQNQAERLRDGQGR